MDDDERQAIVGQMQAAISEVDQDMEQRTTADVERLAAQATELGQRYRTIAAAGSDVDAELLHGVARQQVRRLEDAASAMNREFERAVDSVYGSLMAEAGRLGGANFELALTLRRRVNQFYLSQVTTHARRLKGISSGFARAMGLSFTERHPVLGSLLRR